MLETLAHILKVGLWMMIFFQTKAVRSIWSFRCPIQIRAVLIGLSGSLKI